MTKKKFKCGCNQTFLNTFQSAKGINAYYAGCLDTYMELLKLGIRSVVMPHGWGVGEDELSEKISQLEKEVDAIFLESDFGIITLITSDKLNPKYSHIRKIIFQPEAKNVAERLAYLLTQKSKTASEHREIGELFGYSKGSIDQFIDNL